MRECVINHREQHMILDSWFAPPPTSSSRQTFTCCCIYEILSSSLNYIQLTICQTIGACLLCVCFSSPFCVRTLNPVRSACSNWCKLSHEEWDNISSKLMRWRQQSENDNKRRSELLKQRNHRHLRDARANKWPTRKVAKVENNFPPSCASSQVRWEKGFRHLHKCAGDRWGQMK